MSVCCCHTRQVHLIHQDTSLGDQPTKDLDLPEGHRHVGDDGAYSMALAMKKSQTCQVTIPRGEHACEVVPGTGVPHEKLQALLVAAHGGSCHWGNRPLTGGHPQHSLPLHRAPLALWQKKESLAHPSLAVLHLLSVPSLSSVYSAPESPDVSLLCCDHLSCHRSTASALTGLDLWVVCWTGAASHWHCTQDLHRACVVRCPMSAPFPSISHLISAYQSPSSFRCPVCHKLWYLQEAFRESSRRWRQDTISLTSSDATHHVEGGHQKFCARL